MNLFPSVPFDHFGDHPEQRWPAWKFDMEMHDLYNTLPQQFNCMMMPILDRDAFSRDVNDISCRAQDRPEFFRLLKERMELRQKELMDLWEKAFTQISGRPSLLTNRKDSQWPAAMHIYWFRSFDTYVRYFAEFLSSESDSETASHAQITQDQHPSALSATSMSPALSAPVDAAFSDRKSPSSISTSAPHPRQRTTKPRQTQDSQDRVPSHRRPNQATMRSSDGIQKASSPGASKGPRRSSRLEQRARFSTEDGVRTRSSSRQQQQQQQTTQHQQKVKSKEHRSGYQTRPTQIGEGIGQAKRKRGQEEENDLQSPVTTTTARKQPSLKKRRTGSTVSSVTSKQKRERDQGQNDLQPPTNTARGQPSLKKRRTGNTVNETLEHKESKKYCDDPQPPPNQTGGRTSKRKRGPEEDHSQQSQSTNARGHPSPKKRKRDSGKANDYEPQTSQGQEGSGSQEKKDDIQLYRSGQRGEFEVQGTAVEVSDTPNITAGKTSRRSARTKTGTGTRTGTRNSTKSDH